MSLKGVFNLPTSQEQLRDAEDVIKISTRKIIPKSSSKGANFPGSDIVFDFTLSGNQHWMPSRSFVVIRDSIYEGRHIGAAGAVNDNKPDQPNLSDNIAPALNCQDNLFDLDFETTNFSENVSKNAFPPTAWCLASIAVCDNVRHIQKNNRSI